MWRALFLVVHFGNGVKNCICTSHYNNNYGAWNVSRWKYHIHAIFCEEMELKSFPFDVQNLTIRVETRVPSHALHFYSPVARCRCCLSGPTPPLTACCRLQANYTKPAFTIDRTNFNLRACWTLVVRATEIHPETAPSSIPCIATISPLRAAGGEQQ